MVVATAPPPAPKKPKASILKQQPTDFDANGRVRREREEEEERRKKEEKIPENYVKVRREIKWLPTKKPNFLGKNGTRCLIKEP